MLVCAAHLPSLNGKPLGRSVRPALHIALIERVRDGTTYYVFPGGIVEEGETAPAAAMREAFEELGVYVELHRTAATGTRR